MLGERLRKAREEKGLTQAYVAGVFNISASTVGMYEQGRRDPDTDTLRKFAQLYEVSSDYLLGIDPSPRPKIETIAAHRTDDPMTELPEAARKSVEEFIEYIYKKYAPDKGGKK